MPMQLAAVRQLKTPAAPDALRPTSVAEVKSDA